MRYPTTTLRLGIFLCVVFSVLSGAVLRADSRPLPPRERELLQRAVDAYKRAGNDPAEIRNAYRQIQLLSPRAAEPLVVQVGRDFDRELLAYGKLFALQTETALKQNAEASPADVVRSDKRLAGKRDFLLALGEIKNLLAFADPEAERASQPFSEELKELEAKAVREIRLGPILAKMQDCEIEAIRLTNVERVKQGLSELEIDFRLVLAARDHSKDMVEHDFFAHESPLPGKERFSDRAERFGVKAAAENLYKGRTGDGGAAVKGWMNSEGHRKNILRENLKTIGVGHHQGHFTQLFGR